MSVTANLSILDAARSYTYMVGSTPTTSARTVEFDVFAPNSPGTYQVVFWSHGHRAPTSGGYFNIAKDWADAGYIVVVPTHLDSFDNSQQGVLIDRFPLDDPQWSAHRALDMSFGLDNFSTILADLNATVPGGGYAADLSKVTIAGHSQGAFTAAILSGAESTHTQLAGLADARFTQAVLFSPQGYVPGAAWHGFYYNSPTDHSWENMTIPTLVLTGTADNGTDGQTYKERLDAFEYGPAEARYAMVVSGATHMDLGGSSDASVRAETMASAVTFTNAYAYGDATAKASLVDVQAWQTAHPLVTEVYERAGVSHGGSAGGKGVVAGAGAAESLSGSVTADTITGLGGNDTLSGLEGSDSLVGGNGHDRLIGGLGADTLSGGAGNDTFVFSSTSESTAAAPDYILDFRDSGADRIDLSGIDAIVGGGDNAFVWIGTSSFSAAGQVRYVVSGNDIVIELNTSGTSGAEAVITLANTTASQISSSYFIL